MGNGEIGVEEVTGRGKLHCQIRYAINVNCSTEVQIEPIVNLKIGGIQHLYFYQRSAK